MAFRDELNNLKNAITRAYNLTYNLGGTPGTALMISKSNNVTTLKYQPLMEAISISSSVPTAAPSGYTTTIVGTIVYKWNGSSWTNSGYISNPAVFNPGIFYRNVNDNAVYYYMSNSLVKV